MWFLSPLTQVPADLDAQTKLLQSSEGYQGWHKQVVGHCWNLIWVHWGWKNPAASTTGGYFLAASPGGVKISLKMPPLHLPLPGVSLLPGSSGRLQQELPKACSSCTSFCVFSEADFRLRDVEAGWYELKGRIHQQVH